MPRVAMTSGLERAARSLRVARGRGRQRRPHAAGAEEDERLILGEDRLMIGALRVDPEFQHAARAMEGAGHLALPLELARVAQIHEHHVLASVSEAELERDLFEFDRDIEERVVGRTHAAEALIRYKMLDGDSDSIVIGDCFSALIALTRSLEEVAPFLDSDEGDLRGGHGGAGPGRG